VKYSLKETIRMAKFYDELARIEQKYDRKHYSEDREKAFNARKEARQKKLEEK